MSDNITKAQLITQTADACNTSKATTEKILNTLLANIQEGLTNKKNITLVGFGTFTTSERQARKGRNPKSGEEIDIPASTVPKFKPGKALKDAVN